MECEKFGRLDFMGRQKSPSELPTCERLEGVMKALLLCLILSFLLSVCGVGCAMSQPPVKTLDQWQAERERVRSRSD
jgi:hypothetical protein